MRKQSFILCLILLFAGINLQAQNNNDNNIVNVNNEQSFNAKSAQAASMNIPNESATNKECTAKKECTTGNGITVNDFGDKKEPSTIGKIINWYNSHLNYVSISLLMTLESSFIPFPSEIVVPPAAYQACNPENATLYVTSWPIVNILVVLLFACIGALLGAIINYFLSKWLGRPFVYWFADSKLGHLLLLSGEKVKKAEDYFVEHGNISTFIGRLIPGIRQLISIPAGLSKMKFGPFIFYTALGATSWNIVLALIGYLAQGNKDLINKYSDELSHLILILFVVAIAYIIFKSIRKKNKNKNQSAA